MSEKLAVAAVFPAAASAAGGRGRRRSPRSSRTSWSPTALLYNVGYAVDPDGDAAAVYQTPIGATVTHVYRKAGRYAVTLTATDAAGHSKLATRISVRVR